MRHITVYLLLATLAILGACRSTASAGDNGGAVPDSARALVEHEFINHAWGYSHFGIVVTADGVVHAYQWDRGDTPWTPIEDPLVKQSQLTAKYSHGRKVVGRVGRDTLALINDLIARSENGSLTDRRSVGADMGRHEYISYVFDDRSGHYRKITLRITGDWERSNTSADAMRLADIIQAITQRSR